MRDCLNGGCRGRRTLHLAHLAPQYIIGRSRVALEVDPSHVGALAGINEELERYRIVFFVDLGDARDLGEVVTLVTQAPRDVVLGARHQLL